MGTKHQRINEALQVLSDLDMPRAQQNERSALTLLALLDLTHKKSWNEASSPLMGVTPIMDWARDHYDKSYKPNTRESVRRFTIHQFMQAAIVLQNPDASRPTNSPDTVYQIEPTCLALVRSFGTKGYELRLKGFKAAQVGLAARYAKQRDMALVPVVIVAPDQTIKLSAGEHSELIKKIIEQFAPRFVPGGRLVYVGDTGDKMGYFDKSLLTSLGVTVDEHGKMPDAIIYFAEREWLILAEAVTSHGPVDAKRHEELALLFKNAAPSLVYVSTFPDRRTFTKYIEVISWETEVWLADNPSHLIHFNGVRFLGPYEKS